MTLRKNIFIFCLLFLVVQGRSQTEIPLYNGTPPGMLTEKNNERSLHTSTGRPAIINVSYPGLAVFKPVRQNAARSAIIICPGGGYGRLTIEDGGYEVARNLAAAGITAFVLKYRTWQDSVYLSYRDIPLQDLQQAFKIIYAGAGKWDLDTSHIGLLGFSAGGHLVTMAATATSGVKPAFTILAYPVISFTDSLVSKKLRSRNTLLGDNYTEADKIAFSPELHVTGHTPPAFLVHAEDDSTSLVNNSIAYYRALIDHKVPAQLLLYQKGGHGFAQYNKAEEEDWLPAAIKWLSLNGFYKSEAAKAATQAAPAFWGDILAFKKEDALHPPAANSILFIGSSSFTKWKDVQEYFPGYPIINRGFGGSTLPDVIRYAYDVIIPYKPKQVVIYCGENDLAAADSIPAAEVVRRFKTLFAIIRQNIPGATVSFVSIKPSPVREKIQGKVKEANSLIRAFIKTQRNADFINIYDAMLTTDGKMREELFVGDRLHMKPDGYAIWKKIMLPYLRK